MPFVLDHDKYDNAIGGHFVEELPASRPIVSHLKQNSAERQQAMTESEMQEHNMPPTHTAPYHMTPTPEYPRPSVTLEGQSYQEVPRVQAPPPTNPQSPQGTVIQQSPLTQDPSPAFPSPHSNMNQHNPDEQAAPPSDIPAPSSHSTSRRALRSLAPQPSSKMHQTLAPHKQDTHVQSASRVPPSPAASAMAGALGFQPLQPDMRENVQRSMDVRDDQRRLIEARHEPMQAQMQYTQPQMPQYGQMGVVGPSYYPNELVRAGPVMMHTGLEMRQMMQMAAAMQAGNGQHPGMGVYGPSEGYVRYMAEQQARAAQWAQAAQPGPATSQAPAALQSPNPALQSFTHGQPSMAGYDQAMMPRQFAPVCQGPSSPRSQAPTSQSATAEYPVPYGSPVPYGYGAVPQHVYQQYPSEQQSQRSSPAQVNAGMQTGAVHMLPLGFAHKYGLDGMQPPRQPQQGLDQRSAPEPHYNHSIPDYFLLPSTGTPKPSVNGEFTMADQLERQAFDRHRHSHPSALLSYGPAPGPVAPRMLSSTPATRPHSRAGSLRGGAAAESEVHRRGSRSQSRADNVSQQVTAATQATGAAPPGHPIVPTLEIHRQSSIALPRFGAAVLQEAVADQVTGAAPVAQPPAPTLGGGAGEASEIFRQGSVALSQFGAGADSQDASTRDQASVAVPTPQQAVPSLGMYDFVHLFTTHYRNSQSALLSFEAICLNFNRQIISAQQFYIGIYRILYRTRSMQLLETFQQFAPDTWKGKDMAWFHRAIEKECDEQAAVQQSMSGIAGKRQIEEEPGSGRAEKAAKRSVTKMKQPARKSLIVKLPITLDEHASRMPSQKQPPTQIKPKVDEDFKAPADESEKKRTQRKKKIPINGFRAGGQPQGSTSMTAMTATLTGDLTAVNDAHQQRQDSSPLSSLAGSPSQTDPFGGLEAAESNISSQTMQKWKKGLLPATEVPHVGPIYPSRRAVLSRHDKPYIHALCGLGFNHPQDVKGHHLGSGGKTSNCPVIRARNEHSKGTAERDGEWDAHESCKVSNPDLNYTSVLEGFVILDQVSFDKAQRAGDAGRAAKKLRDGAGAESTIGAAEGEGVGGEIDEMVIDGEMLGEDVVMEDVAVTAKPESEKLDDVKRGDGAARDAKAAVMDAIVSAHMAPLLRETPAQPHPKAQKKAAAPAQRKVVKAGSDEPADDATAPTRAAVFGLRARK
ncbi:hypothetical protein LTR36_005782 [Oleoguttula mirabilis]|uniref:Uncharacterized protein n=1 Tax=Oleoguttula mirabilis TaxID=1507867 RepID=A0AAV9JEN4_9PEZI|nr:hypothetical protein LTR36_005782 [Oleoguttula mirabilis]